MLAFRPLQLALVAPSCCRRPEVTVAQVSVQADVLRECFQEILGIAGAAGVTLTVSNRVPYFRLSTAGTSGSCSVDLPRGSDAVMAHSVTPHGDSESEALTVDPAAEHSVSSEFLAPLVEQAIRPLSSSTTAFIRLNRDVRQALYCSGRLAGPPDSLPAPANVPACLASSAVAGSA